MNPPRSLYQKVTQDGALILLIVWLSYDFAGKTGITRTQATAALPPELQEKIENETHVTEENHRLLQDLHTGIAPRDFNLVPQWTALRSEMDRLRQSLDKNTSSNYYRCGDPPPEMREAGGASRPRGPLTWRERFIQWLGWEAAG